MDRPGYRMRETPTGLDVSLHVQPRARRNQLAGIHDGCVKVKVTAPPVDDAANRAIIDLFAQLLDLPKSRLKIIAGEKSREKVLRISGLTERDFLNRITVIQVA